MGEVAGIVGRVRDRVLGRPRRRVARGPACRRRRDRRRHPDRHHEGAGDDGDRHARGPPGQPRGRRLPADVGGDVAAVGRGGGPARRRADRPPGRRGEPARRPRRGLGAGDDRRARGLRPPGRGERPGPAAGGAGPWDGAATAATGSTGNGSNGERRGPPVAAGPGHGRPPGRCRPGVPGAGRRRARAAEPEAEVAGRRPAPTRPVRVATPAGGAPRADGGAGGGPRRRRSSRPSRCPRTASRPGCRRATGSGTTSRHSPTRSAAGRTPPRGRHDAARRRAGRDPPRPLQPGRRHGSTRRSDGGGPDACIRSRPGATRVVLHVPQGGGRDALPMELRVGVAYDADLLGEVTAGSGRAWSSCASPDANASARG